MAMLSESGVWASGVLLKWSLLFVSVCGYPSTHNTTHTHPYIHTFTHIASSHGTSCPIAFALRLETIALCGSTAPLSASSDCWKTPNWSIQSIWGIKYICECFRLSVFFSIKLILEKEAKMPHVARIWLLLHNEDYSCRSFVMKLFIFSYEYIKLDIIKYMYSVWKTAAFRGFTQTSKRISLLSFNNKTEL